jgi:hypothetical protein
MLLVSSVLDETVLAVRVLGTTVLAATERAAALATTTASRVERITTARIAQYLRDGNSAAAFEASKI